MRTHTSSNHPMNSTLPMASLPLVVGWRNGAPVRLEEIAEVEDLLENDPVTAGAR